MDKIKQRQKLILDRFLTHSMKITELGFLHLMKHCELVPEVTRKFKKLQSMERVNDSNCEQAYIDFLVDITKLGFMYIKCRPEAYKEVQQMQNVFDEYDKLKNDFEKEQTRAKYEYTDLKTQKDEPEVIHSTIHSESEDSIWTDTYNVIRDLSRRLDELQFEIDSPGQKKPLHKIPSAEALKNFNAHLENKLREINDQKKQRRQQRTRKEDKKQQQRQKTQKQPVIVDSDNDSSEVVINYERFTTPLKASPTQAARKPKTHARAGIIERHLIIPIESSETPKITPQYKLGRTPDGKLRMDLKLKFNHGIMYQNKLVDGICIESALPVPNSHNKVK